MAQAIFDVVKGGNGAIVSLRAEMVNATNANDLRQEMLHILRENTKWVCDLSRFRFIDRAGCSLFVSLFKKLQQEGGSLRICCLAAPVTNLFKLIRFDKLFGIFEKGEAAIGAFHG